MSDEVVPETAPGSLDSGQSGDRPRKPRKRGKRNRSKAHDAGQQSAPGALDSQTEPRSHAVPSPRDRERGGRRGSSERSGANGFRDGLDRFFCIAGRRQYPVEWPVSHRQGLAIARMEEVGRRDRDVLVCDKLHQGACVWPDGEPAGDDAPDPRQDHATRVTPPAEPELVRDADA
jgi:hypothetical protein